MSLLCDGGVKVFHSLRLGSLCEDACAADCERSAEALFVSLPGEAVPALGLPEFALAAPEEDGLRDCDSVPRDSVTDEDEPVERPAVTGEKWLCCIDC